MQRKSSSSAEVKFFSLDRERILEELRKYAKKCIEQGARMVVLIGSLARGNYTTFSDVDVVVVYDNAPPRYMDRIELFLDPSLPIDVEPRVYTSEELLTMAKECRLLAKEIAYHGKLLAGDSDLLDNVRDLVKRCSWRSSPP